MPATDRTFAAAAAFWLFAWPAAALDPKEVAPGVYVIAGAVALASPENEGAIANIGFVVGRKAVAAIDPGGSATVGASLVEAVRSITDQPIRYVIYTHMHPDHVLGAAPVVAASGAEVVGHAKLASALAARAEHYLAGARDALGDEATDGLEVVLPDREVAAIATLDLGDRPLSLRAWPTAHTDNDLTVLDERTGTLFAGDLLFTEHLPVIDGSITGWLALEAELTSLPAARAVPGHGPATVDWPAAAAAQFGYLASLADSVRAQIAKGAGLAEAVEAVPPPAGNWALVETFHRRNVTAAFTELEWE
ncbi:quinoprotein relay system zinc metallohydrolase 2 [Palleronia marisminoris]|uniref:Hydroxyacylglutathione hydrolase n=1 Tax=Palleronia marisminoris TaxID=315423 RepID=A0A1Y5SBT6_9RHOB|nr:quinoprotein relay system zinc metallohydrolase 2 [Palleronia marisminoris]SFG71916.1 quinoprotein relay system zinc metallohydrolase 2 [Palleronia marisminoris]SLN36790.1 Hydroxyacylglutathione hydrolase [Palleronia marisminoris]